MTEDWHHLMACTVEELAEVVRGRARIAARSYRMQLDSTDADDNALQRARSACIERGLARMFELINQDAIQADKKEALEAKARCDSR